ncbi:type II toxin-antitoxin system RelE/ParE family toxin [Crenothrix polyspora]|uniref:Putative addiction module toxin RelE/StbE n=1 Tax=Crenothrix polyspora TaxID=360316 RepID=A0A1R4H6A6_9GAMM|nr:type II toxin-antitoxin system RelE/ParE family toxin [Crenothrix polyspora]SJM91706.1 putative addiction module toxin RelE/StbE [Crenothrix polyspora]
MLFLRNMIVKWTKTALKNVSLIADYSAQDKAVRTNTFVQEIRNKTHLLADFSELGRPGRVMGTRELVVHKNYIVVYRVRNEQVEIIRVHHVAKLWPKSFE